MRKVYVRDYGLRLVGDQVKLIESADQWFVEHGYEYHLELVNNGGSYFDAWLYTSDEVLVHLKMVGMLQ